MISGIMENVTYTLKTKNEHFAFLKGLKLIAIFIASWMTLWGIAGWNGITALFENNFELLSDLVFYAAIGIVLVYIFTKSRNKPVDEVFFDYSESEVKFTYKNHFLHYKSYATFPLKELYC